MTRIKICGITNIEDALAAVEFGADAIGLIFALSPRQVNIDVACGICEALPPFVTRVGVFVEEGPGVMQAAMICGLDALQLHGGQSEAFARAAMQSRKVVRGVRVKDAQSIERLNDYAALDAYLLDTHVDGMSGGTGKTFDWNLAVAAKNIGKPVILAGGLNPDNVAEAITRVRPYAVDISSGVESAPGKKDHVKLKELIDNVRSTDRTS